MSKNSVKDFVTNFHMITTKPSTLADIIYFDFTAYTTAKQILTESSGDHDEESISLNKMANKLIRILEEGKKQPTKIKNMANFIPQHRHNQIKITKQRSPLRVQIYLQEQQISHPIKYDKAKNSVITKDASHSRKRTVTPKRQQYCPSPTTFKDQNQNYGNQQQSNQPVKKIIELMRKQYRKDDHIVQPFPEPQKKEEKKEPKMKIVHKKSNSSLPYVCRVVVEDQKIKKYHPRMERPSQKRSQRNQSKPVNKTYNNFQQCVDDRQRQFMHHLKDQFSSICCNELNEEQKKVSEELKLLEMKLGEIVGHHVPNRNYQDPRVSPCRFNGINLQDAAISQPSTKTVRVNLTPKRGRNKGNNRDKQKSPNSSQPQLLSKRLEKAMRV